MTKRLLRFIAPLALIVSPYLQAIDIDEAEPLIGELPTLERTSLMDQEARLVVEMLETMHFESTEISNETFHNLIIEYMESLDYNKLYFLDSDKTDFLAKHGDTLGFKLRYQGDMEAAFEIYTLYRDNAIARIDWVLEQLKQDWTFDTEETYVYDRSESEWPTSPEAANELWRLRIKYELLQEILSDKTQEEAKNRIEKRYKRVMRSISEFGPKDVQEIFLTSLTQMFDPHSSFFSSSSLEDFNISMRLKLIGIGAILSEDDGYTVIKELVAGAPAIRTKKLSPNDRIVAVAQEGEEPVDIIGMGLRKVVEKIRGEKGAVVSLTIIPGDAIDESVREVVDIVRDEVHINSNRCSGEIFEVPNKDGKMVPIGVIDIPTFYGGDEYVQDGVLHVTSVTADVEELVIKMKEAGVQGIVLDLRHNGGGLLGEAINMTGLFIRRGPVVQVREKGGHVISHMDRNPKITYSGPLAVLTSRYSASASEILAGALQNYGRSITIGNSSTHGKGTVQEISPLSQYVLRRDLVNEKAGAAKLTVRKFYLPNGFSTQLKGVIPDIQLQSIEEITATGEADLDHALVWDYIKPVARFVEMTLKTSLVDTLAESSQQRIDSLEEFTFLSKRLNWFEEREKRTEISLNHDQRKSMMETDETFLDDMKEEQRQLAENNFETIEVKLDSVIQDEAAKEAEEAAYAAAKESNKVDETAEDKSGPLVVSTDETDSAEEEEEEPLPEFDILLRETLRIMTDAIHFNPNPQEWAQPALPIAAKSRFEQLVN